MNHINPKVGLAYLEGRLDGAQQAKLERHLADCQQCQAELLEHQTTHDLLQAAGQDFTPEPVRIPKWSDVYERQPARPLLNTIFQYSSQLAMAAVALTLLLVFIWQLRPQEPLLELAPTVTATGQTVFEPTPQATALPSPAVIIIPGIESTVTVPETITEPTPISPVSPPTRITGNEISAVGVSQQGRSAFVVDDTLYIETAAYSGTFTPIADNAQPRPPIWSGNGQEMFFFSETAGSELPTLILWTAETGLLTPLADLVDRSLPEVSFRNVHWAINSRKILLPAFGKLALDSEWDSNVWLVDLDTGHMTLVVEAIALKNVRWLTEDQFLMTLDCGIDCTIMMAYDTAKTLLWKAYIDRPEREAASDYYVVQPDQARILLLNTFDQPQRVDGLAVETGQITPVLELAAGEEFVGHHPYLAADGRILLYLVKDQSGKTAVRTLNLEDLTGGTLYLDHDTFTFGGGAWDIAGNYFIYSVTDPEIGADYVYLWQPGNNRTELIQAAAGVTGFHNFTWTTDGRYVYYNLGSRELWQFDIVTQELRTVAGQ